MSKLAKRRTTILNNRFHLTVDEELVRRVKLIKQGQEAVRVEA